jgi:hypothetical protein
MSILVTRQRVYSDAEEWNGIVSEIKNLIWESEKAQKIGTEKIEFTLL